MFQEITGDFFERMESTQPSAIVCTINTVCKGDGRLVMGAGIAKGFRDTFQGIDGVWGDRTKAMGPQPEKTYPFVELAMKYATWNVGSANAIDKQKEWEPNNTRPIVPVYLVGIHTKYDWRDPSPLDLIDRSVKQLYILSKSLDWKRILMTRPGCGHGGRSWELEVRPLLKSVLDERFEVIHNGH